jgi:hypothetical protein
MARPENGTLRDIAEDGFKNFRSMFLMRGSLDFGLDQKRNL